MGGATGLVGDPSGRVSERGLQTMDAIEKNVKSIESQIQRIFRNATLLLESESAGKIRGSDVSSVSERLPLVVNNADWLRNQTLFGFLSEVGRFVRISQMLSKERHV